MKKENTGWWDGESAAKDRGRKSRVKRVKVVEKKTEYSEGAEGGIERQEDMGVKERRGKMQDPSYRPLC